MIRRRLLNFHETLDYQYANLFGNDGLYIPMVVSLNQLPEDVFYYYVQKDRRNGFYSVTKKNERKTAGMFFTKTEIEIKDNLRYIENQADLQLFDNLKVPEDFFEFFKVKLSLDKQISLADERRSAEAEAEEEDEEEEV